MPSHEHEEILARLSPWVRGADLEFEARRAAFGAAAAKLFPAVADDVAFSAVDAGGVSAEWVETPGAQADRVVVYLHGGGYNQGSPATHRELASRISRRSQARVLTVDYRLAPKHRFPAAVEDAVGVLRWLAGSGHPPARTAIAGDSAGGGLSLATLLALRDAGEPLPACAVAISGWFDLTGGTASSARDDDPLIERNHLLETAAAYLGGRDARCPFASPLFGRFEDLPPLLLMVGGRELLLDETTELAAKAREAGVEVELEVWEGLSHVWPIWGDTMPEAREALDRVGAFLRAHIP